MLNIGCSKDNGYNNNNNPPPVTKNYNQVALVTDVGSGPYSSGQVDANLINPWGIAVNPAGAIWVTNNGTGLSTVYDKSGAILQSPVSIGAPGSSTGGRPTGIVYNGTSDFMVGGAPAKFIFNTEDGLILAWAAGAVATTVADRSAAHAVYKGLELAKDGAANFLYAANFYAGTIDVFDKDFNMVTGKPFVDPTMPAGYAPFNIRSIGGNLYVTYAKQDAVKEDDVKGEGNGYVSIFKPDGSFVKRFASQGALNAPWGIVAAADGFWEVNNTIIIGNFGDGKINVYDQDGAFLGQLKKGDNPIVIDGLWALENIPSTPSTQLFYVAGPGNETHGVFGYVMRAY
ncbi:TIGR03118 family protein [Chitinophaga filiformis]|uniref:TIGR03118 family protein n=1 Tax=Chitinophaga filiformis TaxID=104663 RepID=UPI001F15CE27|nr:TIGR03118 family protein [Chitinophaga filiformis]MCF6402631.1 TIGR03118 family protein [Chitinophaga filiformis]MCF6403451.1 TIGR03118 family protein [Chitinophaga filiformis]